MISSSRANSYAAVLANINTKDRGKMMKRTILVGLMVCSGIAMAPSETFAHNWTDSSGKHKTEGEYIILSDGQVEVHREDGKLVRIPLTKLCEDDQKFARKVGKPVGDETPFAVAGGEEQLAAKPAAKNDDKDTQTVFAEGVGSTKEEAIKDAFRAAVRQVVGEVVDGETFVRNEKAVKDQVLTYSDGFIPEHKVTSEKQDNGLFRVGIEAKVQRRSLIMKLKAANVTVKTFDGGSLFRGVVTQEEAKANAAQLLRKALADLPTMLTAEMVGKPVYDPKGGEAVLKISVKPDRKAFDPFRERLAQLLNQIALRHESILIHSTLVHRDRKRAGAPPEPRSGLTLPIWFRNDSKGDSKPIWPLLSVGKRNKDLWGIALCSFNDANHTTTRWTLYVLDADHAKSLGVFAGQTRLVLSLCESAGGTVTEDEVQLSGDATSWQNHLPMGFLRRPMADDSGQLWPIWATDAQSNASTGQQRERVPHWVLIGPYFLYASSNQLVYAPECIIQRHVKLTLDELKRVNDVRCKVAFRHSRGK